MFLLSSGIIIGILLSILAVLSAKKFEVIINEPYKSRVFREKGKIIKREDSIEEVINS